MARGPLAGTSGPGKFSKRTDLPSAGYGEGVETAAIQQGAPLAKTPNTRPMSQSAMGMAPSQVERVTSLYAPSERADEPITSGIAMGAGPGPETLGMNTINAQVKLSDSLAKMLPFDSTGEITALYQEALARGD